MGHKTRPRTLGKSLCMESLGGIVGCRDKRLLKKEKVTEIERLYQLSLGDLKKGQRLL